MKAEITKKFKALAVALMINGLGVGGVAYLFNGQIHDHAPVVSVAAIGAPNASTGRA